MSIAEISPRTVRGLLSTDPITMSDSGLVYIELRPDLDFETIRGNLGIPTLVTQGIFRGFSLPVGGANEELFGAICVPSRWDGASDIYVEVYCWLALAEDSKNFKLQLTWEHYCPTTDAVPITSANVEVQTATGALAAQFQSYKVQFQLTYGDLAADDLLGLRFRRVAADPVECAGEIVINHYGMIFRRDKMGVATP